MSNDKCKGPMSNDDGENPMPNDISSMLTAFQNLSFQSNNYNTFEQGESSHINRNIYNTFEQGESSHINSNIYNTFEQGESSHMNNERRESNHINSNIYNTFEQGVSSNMNNGRRESSRIHSNNYNTFEQGESSNMNNERRESSHTNSNRNHNFNIQYNIGQISLGASRRLPPAAGLRAPPLTPSSWIAQPGASSSTNPGQPSASPQSFLRSDIHLSHENLCVLLHMMMCPTRDSKFLRYLGTIDTYQAVERERFLLNVGLMITTTNSTFLDLATNQNGSHALRALLKRSPRLDVIIFEAIYINFCSLMNNEYGRYLIIPTLRAIDKLRKVMLYKLTLHNTLSLAVEETGCVALNDVFQEIKGLFRDLILEKIALYAGWLSFQPYGTYTVQNFLTLQNPRATQAIAETLYGSFFRLAKEKEGSYVVEKCLKSEFGREKVLEEFRGNDKEWVRMAKDKFGNYVAQCAMRVMKQGGKKEMLREFVEKLRPHFREMKFGYGKNTLRVIEEEIVGFILKFPDDLLNFLY